MAKDPLRNLLRLPRVPQLTEEEKKQQAEFTARRAEQEKARPCYGQDRDSIKAWMKANAKPGLIVVARSTMGSMGGDYEYALDEVTELHSSNRFFYTRGTYAWNTMDRGRYYYSGQSLDTPTGQVDLLIPTPAVVRAAIHGKKFVMTLEVHQTLVQRAIEQTAALFGEDVSQPVAANR